MPQRRFTKHCKAAQLAASLSHIQQDADMPRPSVTPKPVSLFSCSAESPDSKTSASIVSWGSDRRD